MLAAALVMVLAQGGPGRLSVAALGNNTVEVIDLSQGKVIHKIDGLHEPQGIFVFGRADRGSLGRGRVLPLL